MFCLFFFEQKTAYELRISDWSSDVCSSDLHIAGDVTISREVLSADVAEVGIELGEQRIDILFKPCLDIGFALFDRLQFKSRRAMEIGRASCRARVCKYV